MNNRPYREVIATSFPEKENPTPSQLDEWRSQGTDREVGDKIMLSEGEKLNKISNMIIRKRQELKKQQKSQLKTL